MRLYAGPVGDMGIVSSAASHQRRLLGRVFPMACQTDASIERTLAHGDALRLTLPFAFAVICRAACSILLSTSFFLTFVLMNTRPLDIPNSIGYMIGNQVNIMGRYTSGTIGDRSKPITI